MKKLAFLILICFVLVLSFSISVATEERVSFVVDGTTVYFGEGMGIPHISPENRVLIPLRVALSAIDAYVDWDEQTRTVLTRKGNVTVNVPVGKNEIVVNGNIVQTDVAAIIRNGRTYLPLRAVLEAYGYAIAWDETTRTVYATELTPFNINGGTTGAFLRKQLAFSGFTGIQAYITLPFVPYLDEGDCPYIYFGFDWMDDRGNAEGGFQFIDDPSHRYFNKFTVFLRQGNEWRWPQTIIPLEQGSTHHMLFYADVISETRTDLVMVLDGIEVVRKESAVNNFESASAKTVIGMATTKIFDGQNCNSILIGARFANVSVREYGSEGFVYLGDFELYSSWRPYVGANGMWFGTSVCVPSFIHFETDGKVSIFNTN